MSSRTHDQLQEIQTSLAREAADHDAAAGYATARLLDALSSVVDYTRRVYEYRADRHYVAGKSIDLITSAIQVWMMVMEAHLDVGSSAEPPSAVDPYDMAKLMREIVTAIASGTWGQLEHREIYRSDAAKDLALAHAFTRWAEDRSKIAQPDED